MLPPISALSLSRVQDRNCEQKLTFLKKYLTRAQSTEKAHSPSKYCRLAVTVFHPYKNFFKNIHVHLTWNIRQDSQVEPES